MIRRRKYLSSGLKNKIIETHQDAFFSKDNQTLGAGHIERKK